MLNYLKYWYYLWTLPWGHDQEPEKYRWHDMDAKGISRIKLWGWAKTKEVDDA